MRTTGGRVGQVRLGMWAARISLDVGGRRRRGCCTLVLHPNALTLKRQLCSLIVPGGVTLLASYVLVTLLCNRHAKAKPLGDACDSLGVCISA